MRENPARPNTANSWGRGAHVPASRDVAPGAPPTVSLFNILNSTFSIYSRAGILHPAADVKILALTNLYPPHHAGTFDTHCQNVVEALRTRGHTILVLTSTHGLRVEQRDEEVHRCLLLNGAYEIPRLTAFPKLRAQEMHNTQMLLEAITRFQPEIVHVFSLHGLSKSLIFTLRHARVPVAYDVCDHWLCRGVPEDPWLRYWNAPSLPFFEQSARAALEMSGERGRLDATAPTRMIKGYDRIPGLYGDDKARAAVGPEFHHRLPLRTDVFLQRRSPAIDRAGRISRGPRRGDLSRDHRRLYRPDQTGRRADEKIPHRQPVDRGQRGDDRPAGLQFGPRESV